LLAVLFSLILGLAFRRRAQQLSVLIAVVALTLSLWCAFETVIAPYYVWPTIAVALIGLSGTSRLRSAATLVFALLADVASNADLHAEWVWWVIVSALSVLLVVSWPKARSEPAADAWQLPVISQPQELTSLVAGGSEEPERRPEPMPNRARS